MRCHKTVDAARDALIEDDLNDLTDEEISDIAATYWEEFKPLAVRWLEARWASGTEVWSEAQLRGFWE